MNLIETFCIVKKITGADATLKGFNLIETFCIVN